MTSYERGDVVLVPFPFSERLVTKKRPAVVVSSNAYHRGLPRRHHRSDHQQADNPTKAGRSSHRGWQDAGLVTPSLARAKLATLHSALILRRLGTMPRPDMRAIDRRSRPQP